MRCNVLITSISKKVWLVKAFQEAFKKEGLGGKVIAVDTNPLSAGLYISNARYLVPSSDNPDFIPTILEICIKEDIRLLIPTRDGELFLFAQHKDIFKEKGIQIMVSDEKVIDITNDKFQFYQFLIKYSLPAPQSYLPEEINFFSLRYPLLVKSRFGAGSQNIVKVKNEKELKFFIEYIENPFIQEFVDGTEYTVDLFSDFNKNVIAAVSRERIETFCGESYKGKIIKDSKMIAQAKNLAEKLGTVGHITLQYIESASGIKCIEVNPRFGGGAMLGIMAGVSSPRYLLKLINNKQLEPEIGQIKEGLTMLRYTDDFFIEESSLLKKESL